MRCNDDDVQEWDCVFYRVAVPYTIVYKKKLATIWWRRPTSSVYVHQFEASAFDDGNNMQ